MKSVFFLIMISASIIGYSQSTEEPLSLKFNRIYYFAPSTEFLPSKSEVKKINSYLTIDFELNTINIVSYYSNPPTESTYTIKSIDNSNSNLYKFVCSASNYAEVIIELDISNNKVTRKVTHNGILHRFYNE